MMNKTKIEEAALRILEAKESGRRLAGFSDTFLGNGITREEAVRTGYDVQDTMIGKLESRGIRIAGYKAAYTSAVMRAKNNITTPYFGQIPDNCVLRPGEGFPMPAHGVLKAEPEVLFVMGKDLAGPRVTLGDVINAVTGWLPGFELVVPVFDSREHDIPGEIAENMSFAAVAPGACLRPLAGTDFNELNVRFLHNGQITGEDRASKVMDGSPLYSLVELANHLIARGKMLRAGDLVLSGTPVAPAYLNAGDEICAEFSDREHCSVVSIRIY